MVTTATEQVDDDLIPPEIMSHLEMGRSVIVVCCNRRQAKYLFEKMADFYLPDTASRDRLALIYDNRAVSFKYQIRPDSLMGRKNTFILFHPAALHYETDREYHMIKPLWEAASHNNFQQEEMERTHGQSHE